MSILKCWLHAFSQRGGAEFFCLRNDEGRELLVVVKMLVTCFSHKEEGLILSMEGGKREVCSLFKGELTMLEG